MPKLTDIAIMTIAKKPVSDTQSGLYALRRTFPKPELTFANRLRTTLKVGDESKLTQLQIPMESKGVFASWRSELEKSPMHDLYKSEPLNHVKDNTKEDVQEMMLKIKHREWLAEVDERMRKLGFKP